MLRTPFVSFGLVGPLTRVGGAIAGVTCAGTCAGFPWPGTVGVAGGAPTADGKVEPPPVAAPMPGDAPAPPVGTVVRSAPWNDLPSQGKAAIQSAPEDASKSPVSLQLNLDVASAYYFRGIRQEDRGVVVQPAAKVTLRLWEKDGASIDAFASTWNSFHTRSTGTERTGLIGHWYEMDGSGGLTITSGNVSLTGAFTVLSSPSNAFGTVQELDLTVAYDDSELLGAWALHPYAMFAIEVGANGSDGKDSDPGSYLEIGVAPGLTFNLDGGSCGRCNRALPITLTFPVIVGLSLSDYYQDATGSDSTLGYVSVGSKVSVPIPCDAKFGTWTFTASVSALFLGPGTREFNAGKRTEVIGTVGVQANF